MCNRIQATRQQRSGITWRKKKKKQNNNKQAKKRRKKKNKNKKRKKTKKRNRRRKRKRRRREKRRDITRKKRFGKNLGVKFLPPFFGKKILFFWAFFEILRQKYVHLARALPYMPTPSPNGRILVYFDVHYDKLYYETQYLLRSMHITRNTIEDCAGNGSWKCATESKLPGSKDLESLGEIRRRNKIIINKLRRGGRKKQK